MIVSGRLWLVCAPGVFDDQLPDRPGHLGAGRVAGHEGGHHVRPPHGQGHHTCLLDLHKPQA